MPDGSFDLRYLRYATAAAEHGSIRKAAISLDVPQSTVSRRILTLEDRLPGTDETANYEYEIPLNTTPEPTVRMRKRDRDRLERARLAGVPKPTLRERAVALAVAQGEVRRKDLTEIGVHRCYLARMCDEGLLVKLGFGRYRTAVPKTA
jgi:hypothetical protein